MLGLGRGKLVSRYRWKSVSAVLLAGALIAFGAITNGSSADAAASRPSILVAEGDSIQAAIDMAAEGSVIELVPGRYEGSLSVDKSLTILGPAEGEARIAGGSSGAVLRIAGEGIEVRLETLSICCSRAYNGHGIAIEGSAIVELHRVLLVENAWFGLWAADRTEVIAEDCTFASNGSAGLMAQDFAKIRLDQCIVRDNTSHGILALHFSELTVDDTEILGNWAGIWAWDAARVALNDTGLRRNADYGAIASNASLLVIENSTIEGNGHHGLLFEESSRGLLRGCLVTENGADGLFATQDAILEILDSEFTRNGGAGIRVASSFCIGGFDPKEYFAGTVEGARNRIPGPDASNSNAEAALCPWPSAMWPEGFVAAD